MKMGRDEKEYEHQIEKKGDEQGKQMKMGRGDKENK